VPQKIKEAKRLIQSASLLIFEAICDGYQDLWHTNHYGDVEQKWLLERSEQATKQEHNTLNPRMLKQTEGSREIFKKLCQQAFPYRTDALAAVEKWQEKQATLVVEATVLDVPVYEGKGRPGQNQQPVEKVSDPLKAQDEYFPYMKKKPMQTPTARWVSQCFIGIVGI
jgi:transposase